MKDNICSHCKMPKAIRNPSGFCDHLYYPDNCKICKKRENKEVEKQFQTDRLKWLKGILPDEYPKDYSFDFKKQTRSDRLWIEGYNTALKHIKQIAHSSLSEQIKSNGE